MAHPLPRTALLLEPEPVARRLLCRALAGAGVARVLEADSAAEALRVLSAELVQLVLTPWEVPDMAGRSLLQALRNRGRNRDLPVVLLDPGLARAQVVAAVKAGAAGRLSLPLQGGAVQALLAELVAPAAQPRSPTAAQPHSALAAQPRSAPRAKGENGGHDG